MKLLYNGIHRRVGFIVQHSGGYNREYHITKMSERLDIDRDTLAMLFKEASKSNILQYIDLLETGVPIEKVFSMVDNDNRIAHERMIRFMAYTSKYFTAFNYLDKGRGYL